MGIAQESTAVLVFGGEFQSLSSCLRMAMPTASARVAAPSFERIASR